MTSAPMMSANENTNCVVTRVLRNMAPVFFPLRPKA